MQDGMKECKKNGRNKDKMGERKKEKENDRTKDRMKDKNNGWWENERKDRMKWEEREKEWKFKIVDEWN